MKLRKYLRQYLSERDLAPTTAKQYTTVVSIWEQWLGRKAKLADFTNAKLNKFLDHSLKTCKSRYTVKTRRGLLLAIAREAFRSDLIEREPRRVKKIRTVRKQVEVWKPEEIERLYKAAEKLKGTVPGCKTRRSDVGKMLVALAWDTALRRSDLHRVTMDSIRKGLLFTIVQQKSQSPKACRINESTRQLILSTGDPDRKHAIPRWGRVERLTYMARQLMKLADLESTSGQVLHKIRKSSITHIESIEAGIGWIHGGHSKDVCQRHYISEEEAYADMPTPVSVAG